MTLMSTRDNGRDISCSKEKNIVIYIILLPIDQDYMFSGILRYNVYAIDYKSGICYSCDDMRIFCHFLP